MDLKILLTWYVTFFLLGIIGLPLANFLFKGWRDKGYGMAKFLGMFLVAMPLWLLASLHIVPFTETTVTIFFLGGFFIALYYLYKKRIMPTKLMIVEELIFLALLLIWGLIRATNSQIEGTEKLMNVAFMNSIDRSTFFPPKDPWYYPLTINYYYLGHYMFVFVGKLAQISVSYTYNLALITIIAHAFISLMSLFVELFKEVRRIVRVGLAFLGASWICFGGNMHYPFYWLTAKLANTDFSYYFPNATRIISYTINEFPAYSIVLGDVHGHYLGFPFMIIVAGLLLSALRINIRTSEKIKFNAIISILICALYGVNSWDFITANFLFAMVHVFQALSEKGEWKEKIQDFVVAEAALLIPGILFMIPYFLNFSPAVGGIGIVPLNVKSEIKPWLLMWGMFIVITVLAFAFNGKWLLKRSHEHVFALILLIASVVLIIGVEFIFVKDIFFASNPAYFRTNTVFKFYYQAWVLWGIAATWFVYSLVATLRRKTIVSRIMMLIIIGILYIGSITYIYKAVTDFYPVYTPTNVALDGYDYIRRMHPDDYALIQWINANIQGQPVEMEAVGDAYTYYARISANTGLPTVLGWPTHEWQWRNIVDQIYHRKDEVHTMYSTKSLSVLTPLLQAYNVKYIVVGENERQAYSDLNEDLFKQLGKVVFSSGNTRLYQLN